MVAIYIFSRQFKIIVRTGNGMYLWESTQHATKGNNHKTMVEGE